MKKPIPEYEPLAAIRRRNRRTRRVIVLAGTFLSVAVFGLMMYSIARHSSSFAQGLLYCYSALAAIVLLVSFWLLVQSRAYWKHRVLSKELVAQAKTVLDDLVAHYNSKDERHVLAKQNIETSIAETRQVIATIENKLPALDQILDLFSRSEDLPKKWLS